MSVKKVKKAIIPAAGCGTRFMPITKSVPKEMLVLVDKPALHYIVEECANSGITDVRIVVREGKESIVNYFTPSPSDTPELKNLLEKVNVSFAWQKTPRGTGDTIMLCRDFVKDEPFAVLFGDDVVISDKPCTGQLIAAYEKTGRSVVGVQTVPDDEAVRYGVVEKGAEDGRITEIRRIIEKPAADALPSNLCSLGRFVLTSGIFEAIRLTPEREGEAILPEAVSTLARSEGAVAYEFEGRHYDVGNKLGYAIAARDLAAGRFGKDFTCPLSDGRKL